MKLFHNLEPGLSELRLGAITIGNFDGVHHGHARILRELRRQADRVRGPAVVFTFSPHPVQILRPQQTPPPLTWPERKSVLLGELGVDAMIAYPTDRELLELSPKMFFQTIVHGELAAQALVEGPNFYFGKGRSGNIATLQQLCQESEVNLHIVEPLLAPDGVVSSSRLRQLIQTGDVQRARQLMTQPYRIQGTVVPGERRGATIGFPTANLDRVSTLCPAPGVYAGRTFINQSTWDTAIHIGNNPTFQEDEVKIECHLLDFSESLYGQSLEVEFLKRLRDVVPFNSVSELQEQLHRDVDNTRNVCREFTVSSKTPQTKPSAANPCDQPGRTYE
ncbi:MAG: bifunctional riboflavin kinase/FAD synthetase [Planctomycetota bacterium]|nr:bifunctional riboflavin kinase/FAD synthetase [Planctomycetota bacterium]